MFSECSSLKELNLNNFNNFNTNNVTDMSFMFMGCLEELKLKKKDNLRISKKKSL